LAVELSKMDNTPLHSVAQSMSERLFKALRFTKNDARRRGAATVLNVRTDMMSLMSGSYRMKNSKQIKKTGEEAGRISGTTSGRVRGIVHS
jgi:hypothetical protein